LDDPALGGQRYYHELHFFCAECGDPFLDPSRSSAAPKGPDGESLRPSDEDDVGFTVYKGHPYCESCHVQLRLPRCGSGVTAGVRTKSGMGCGKPIREGAIEAIGRRWHHACFTCSVCLILRLSALVPSLVIADSKNDVFFSHVISLSRTQRSSSEMKRLIVTLAIGSL
jgi:LIM domain